ncbi:polyprenyl synthetase [Streptomyces sp. NPDC102406]|uniref:polyprenyl synthetase n=1 Tax=Streptomyces sp. NPDC102406 TaxID=3366171 RepID=UPI0037F6805A
MTRGAERRGGVEEHAILLVAGLADLAVSAVGTGLSTVRGLLRRSDTADLAAAAEDDLVARGRLVLDRYAAVPEAHLEILARHARARRAADDV